MKFWENLSLTFLWTNNNNNNNTRRGSNGSGGKQVAEKYISVYKNPKTNQWERPIVANMASGVYNTWEVKSIKVSVDNNEWIEGVIIKRCVLNLYLIYECIYKRNLLVLLK